MISSRYGLMLMLRIPVLILFILRVRDVSGWLYLLIGASVVFTFIMTNRFLDKVGTPVGIMEQAPHSVKLSVHHCTRNSSILNV